MVDKSEVLYNQRSEGGIKVLDNPRVSLREFFKGYYAYKRLTLVAAMFFLLL